MIDNIETERPKNEQDTEETLPSGLPAATGHHVEASLRCPCGAVIAIPLTGLVNGDFVIPSTLMPTATGFLNSHSHIEPAEVGETDSLLG